MIPIFPDFKKIALDDHIFIEDFTKQFPPYNDFTFVDLWTYNPKDTTTLSILNNNLIVKRQDILTHNFFYSFIGNGNAKDTIIKLLQRSKEEDLPIQLRQIPEINIEHTPDLQEYFSIKEDQDSFDYILSISDIADLTGSKYHEKRNLVKKFKNLYPDYAVKQLDLTKGDTQQEMIELFFLWEKHMGKVRSQTETELGAFQKLFDLIHILNIEGIGVYIQNKLIGFSTFHRTQDSFALLSFEKGNTSYNGIYAILHQETAKYLKTLGYLFLNYEQDLGIPGLKKAKQLWRPIFYLKKYTIEEKI